jgi:hypothetical protein
MKGLGGVIEALQKKYNMAKGDRAKVLQGRGGTRHPLEKGTAHPTSNSLEFVHWMLRGLQNNSTW